MNEFSKRHEEQRSESGLRAANRSGCQPERPIQVGVGLVAKPAAREIWMAETRAVPDAPFDALVEIRRDKYPKAVQNLNRNRHAPIAFCDFPTKNWSSIRATNPIESTFATIRHRHRHSKGCLNRNSMTFKPGQCAEHKWRRLRGIKQLGQVTERTKFKDGIELTPLNDQVAA